MGRFRVAVAGSTGLVGTTLLHVLERYELSLVRELVALASERSAGKSLNFNGRTVQVRTLDENSFNGCDLVFFSAGAAMGRRFAPIAAGHAEWVIDNSSAFRQDPAIPLVVPEVNGHVLQGYRGVVANPNCSTIQMVVALQPLHRAFGLESVIVSTYQSVSGSGGKGVRALDHEFETGERHEDSPYPYPIAHQALPQVDVLGEDGWSGEERKIISETRKIMDLPSLRVVPTAVRVPVRIGHSESIYARFSEAVSPEQARRILARAPGIIVEDDPRAELYPLARRAAGRDEVFVGRIRQDLDDDHALAFWVVADNLRKGAATNAVQIAEQALTINGKI